MNFLCPENLEHNNTGEKSLFVKLGVVRVNTSRHAEFVAPEFVASFVVFAETVTRQNFGKEQMRQICPTDQTDQIDYID